jgi:hypothetical protein
MAAAISRRAGLVARAEGDEVLVIDIETLAAHCLSGGTAAVWAATEAPASVDELVAATGLEREIVREAVEALQALGLLETPAGLGRRAVLARGAAVGAAVVAAGVVSIPLPAAARANSSTFTLTKVSCATGILNVLLGSPLTFLVNITGVGRLTPGATYTLTFSYSSAVLNPLGVGIIPTTQTDSFTFTADASGRIAAGAGKSFTTTAAYRGGMSVVTVTNNADLTDKNVFTASPVIASC